MRFQVSMFGCVFMASSHARHTSSSHRSRSTAAPNDSCQHVCT